jgi:3-oxoacyl-[acyl-carrier-protein] synthase II
VLPEGFSKKDINRRDRYTIFALYAADQALAQSGIDINKENPNRCGVTLGTGIGGIETEQDNISAYALKGPRRVSPLAIPKCLPNMAAGEVAIRFGFTGPNKAVVTACAAGTQAIGDAANVIRAGRADVMISGGAEGAVIPFGVAAFAAMRALSTRNDAPEKASRPFDKDRDGFVMGDGSGVLVLESEAHAKARGATILGEVLGFGETCDAHHITAPEPNGAGAVSAMRAAVEDAGINLDAIDYFNAHGTSTKYNDASESAALRAVFGDAMPPVSSTKSMIGHLLGAAGAVEAIACLMTIRDGVIHPSINYDTPDPDCPVNIVANVAQERPVRVVMSNSLGFGGHNASIILKHYE